MPEVPLAVDLDGTLTLSDTTFELCVEHIKRRWLVGFVQLILWFLRSKSGAKQILAKLYLSELSIESLPISNLRHHSIYKSYVNHALVSGSNDSVVQKIGSCFEEFDFLKGSDAEINLIGLNKAEFLKQKYPDGFDYVGDSDADIEVWRSARKAYAYNIKSSTEAKARDAGVDIEVIARKQPALPKFIKACRLHQWSKNGLILAIPLLNSADFQWSWLLLLTLGFLAFGLVANATYLLNDILDIQADRKHEKKKNRPFANGSLPIPTGIKGAVAMLTVGVGIASLLGSDFLLVLLSYLFISLAYSVFLKKLVILDVLVLCGLFCIRVVAGGQILDQDPSSWFLISVAFFFLSLALGKRAIELNRSPKHEVTLLQGRGYQREDLLTVIVAGQMAGFASVLTVLNFVLLSPSILFTNDFSAVMIAAVLLFWLMRFWLLVGRDEVDYDPVIFAMRDSVSLFSLAALIAVVVFERYYVAGL